jgi:hypothetical protein
MKKEQNTERNVCQKKEKREVIVTGDGHARGCAMELINNLDQTFRNRNDEERCSCGLGKNK